MRFYKMLWRFIVFSKKRFNAGVLCFVGIVLLVLFVAGCEPDDFCQQSTLTPRLIVRFYNSKKPSQLKKIERIGVRGQGNDAFLYTGKTIDSIVLPLKISDDKTVYEIWQNFSVDSSGNITGNKENITISYILQEVLVSKACGYKLDFYNVKAEVQTQTAGWIKSVKVKQDKVQNESKAHIHIYH